MARAQACRPAFLALWASAALVTAACAQAGRYEERAEGHGAIARNLGADVLGADVLAAAGSSQPAPCAGYEEAINDAASRILAGGDRRQSACDRETGHGRPQGAYFDIGEARRFKPPAKPGEH